MDRAMEAGIDDVGIGVLFGLSDWRFEVLAMLSHAQYLEKRFNVGPHTISVPRIEPAEGAPLSKHPPQLISDDDFKMMIAILRLAVPYTGLILSTRETADLRRQCLELGISQLSAGSSTEPGGYSENKEHHATQFATSDNRPLEEVICDVVKNGFIPSFCTGCYRLGRTGSDFMDLAKPGEIRRHCDPNAVSSFTEYLRDYASEETGKVGETAIESMISTMDQQEINRVREMVRKVKNGESDVFC
jgi:2-iminoacetate synthase